MKLNSLLTWIAGTAVALVIVAGKWGPGWEMFNGVDFQVRYAGLVLLIFSGMLFSLRQRKVYYLDTSVKVALFGLLLYLILSVSWSVTSDTSISKFIDMVFLALVVFTIAASQVAVRREFATAFWLSVLVFALLLSLSGYEQTSELERLSVLGGGSITFARIMALGTLACYFLFYDKMRIIFYGAVIYFSVFISLSGARGVMLAMSVPLVIVLVSDRRIKTVMALLIALGLAVIYLPNLPIIENVVAMLERRVIDLTIERGYASGRSYIYDEALAQWNSRPLIGVGLGGFSYQRFTYAHNIFLELLSESGLIGFMLMLFFLYSIKKIFMIGRSTRENSIFLVILLIFLSAQFSGNLYDSRILFIVPLFSSVLYLKKKSRRI